MTYRLLPARTEQRFLNYSSVTSDREFETVPWETWTYRTYTQLQGGVEFTFTDEVGNGHFDFAPMPPLPQSDNRIASVARLMEYAPGVIYKGEPMPITDALPDMKRELKFYPAKNNAPKKLTREQIQYFNEKGYIFPLDVFSKKETEANRAYFDKLMGKAQAAGKNSYSINGWHRSCKGIYDLLVDNRILDYVEDLLGPNLVSRMTHYFNKMPGDGKKVAFHQDASYWPLTPSKTVTVWLAIDDVDLANAPMEVIPGSHLHGQIPFERSTPEENNVLGQSVHHAEKFGDPVPLIMKAGQISIHSDLLLHGSRPNTSQRRRCGLTLRYMPPEVRTRETDHSPAVLCRGTDPSGYWQHVPRPDGDKIPKRK